MCTYTEFSFLVKLFSNVPEQRSFSIIMYKICRKKKIKVHFRFLQRNRIRINFVMCRAPLLWYIVKYIIIKRIVLYYCVCQNVLSVLTLSEIYILRSVMISLKHRPSSSMNDFELRNIFINTNLPFFFEFSYNFIFTFIF